MPDMTAIKTALNNTIAECRRALAAIEADEQIAAQLDAIPPAYASSDTKHMNSPANTTSTGDSGTPNDPGADDNPVRLTGSKPATPTTTATATATATPKADK